MTKAKPKGLLEGSRKKALMKKVNEMKWNKSFNNMSMSDITSFYEKRFRIFKKSIQSLRENNENLAKSLADQKSTAQLWYSETISLKSKLLEYHERLVNYQLTDTGQQEDMIVAETERRLAAFVAPIKAAIKSGIDNAIALADDLENMKAITEAISTRRDTMVLGQKSPMDSSVQGSSCFQGNITMGLPPLIQRTSLLSSESSSTSTQQKMQKISQLLRAEKIRTREIECNNSMSDIEEISSGEESNFLEDHIQVEKPVCAVVFEKKKTPEVKNLRRSTRQSKMSTNFQLYLDQSSSDSEEEAADVSTRYNIQSASSDASTLSDFEKNKRSGSYVSKRSRKTRSSTRMSKGRKASAAGCLALSFDSPLRGENCSTDMSTPQTCNRGLLITPSPLTTVSVSSPPCEPSPITVHSTNMELTVCESHTSTASPLVRFNLAADQSPDEIAHHTPIQPDKKWFKREARQSESAATAAAIFGKTPYDTTMLEVSPPALQMAATIPRATTTDSTAGLVDVTSEQCRIPVSCEMEANKENTCADVRPTKKSRRTSRLSGHVDSPVIPSSRQSLPFAQLTAAPLSPAGRRGVSNGRLDNIKKERISSVWPTPIETVSAIVKRSPCNPDVNALPSRRPRRTAGTVSYLEPKLNAKCRQGDAIGKSIYSDFIPSLKGKRSGKNKK